MEAGQKVDGGGAGHGADGAGTDDAFDNVIRLPRDWIGPLDELIPFGSAADRAATAAADGSTAVLEPPDPAVIDDRRARGVGCRCVLGWRCAERSFAAPLPRSPPPRRAARDARVRGARIPPPVRAAQSLRLRLAVPVALVVVSSVALLLMLTRGSASHPRSTTVVERTTRTPERARHIAPAPRSRSTARARARYGHRHGPASGRSTAPALGCHRCECHARLTRHLHGHTQRCHYHPVCGNGCRGRRHRLLRAARFLGDERRRHHGRDGFLRHRGRADVRDGGPPCPRRPAGTVGRKGT